MGVGVVSRNGVAAATELAYEERCRIMLIASRRQVDGAELGGGYVEGWSTDAFADYVRARDPSGRVALCRDHGGPWQHPSELGTDDASAVASALASYARDLRAGFELLHIDTTATLEGDVENDAAVERLLRVYAQVAELAEHDGRHVGFEVSLGAEGAEVTPAAPFAARLRGLIGELGTRGLPIPRFVVTATGTKVRGRANVGAIADRERRSAARPQLKALARACRAAGTALKAHNCDYLGTEGWNTLRGSGVAAANVAPEYGIAETRALVELLRSRGLASAANDFLTMAYDSGAWRKWVRGAPALPAMELGLLAGHYLFSTPEGGSIRALAADELDGGVDELDERLKACVKAVIRRHLRALPRWRRFTR